jgi:hypothetical protein
VDPRAGENEPAYLDFADALELYAVIVGGTSIYLQGIDIEEIISTVHARRAPMMSATAGLQL